MSAVKQYLKLLKAYDKEFETQTLYNIVLITYFHSTRG